MASSSLHRGAVHVVGDSHVGFLRGTSAMTPVWPDASDNYIPGINVYRAGSHLAYSITRAKHPGRLAFKRVLQQLPKGDPVLLVYGEIDCRFQIAKQAQQQNRSIAAVAEEVAEQYVAAAARLCGARPLAFLASCPAMSENPIWKGMYVGTLAQRARAVKAFNRALHAAANERGLPVIDITRKLGHSPRALEGWYSDRVHLAPKAAPLVIDRLAELGWLADAATTRAVAVALGKLPLLPMPMPPGLETPEQGTAALVDRAALECLALGARRIAIFGAGKHTQRIGLKGFAKRGLKVTAILDDHPAGDRMLGVPLLKPTAARGMFDAVVVSSDAHERALADRARRAAGKNVPVVCLYEWKRSGV